VHSPARFVEQARPLRGQLLSVRGVRLRYFEDFERLMAV
jgi:hypothetical protein